MFPRIRKLTETIRQDVPLIGSDTIHFHGVSEFHEMVNAATSVVNRSELSPRRYQWRAFFFSCLNNTLLCLPTGMGKTLIANMLMKAYQQRNPNKGQVFVVPTIVLVSNLVDCSLKCESNKS
jgi:replicative superfamily II helicase